MFHLVSVWLTRLVVAGVLIALVLMYGPAWFAEQAKAPTETPATLAADKAAPVAPTAKATAVAPAEKPAAAATEPAAAAEPTAASATSFARCQPIGRTARGELVYSMDCR
uniref:Uncharacterized protein n=1 Tax=Rhodopseudomonas palustris (strain BisA53) TaxID=316055 RepID=Q07KH9_RHOP5